MMWAGWIRLRASLMAMRRTSWIDQRINDGVAMLLCLPWFGVAFFLAAAAQPAKNPELVHNYLDLRFGGTFTPRHKRQKGGGRPSSVAFVAFVAFPPPWTS